MPVGVVTVMSTVPVPAGDTALRPVEETTLKLLAAVVPKSTAVAPVKFVPVTVTVVPPDVGPEVGLIAVTVGELPTASTVPVSCERLGELVVVTVIVTHAGGPELNVWLETSSHPPAPLLAEGFHHVTASPLFKLQFFIVREVKVLPADTLMSKYSPLAEKVGVPTGSELNCDTVIPPIPVPDAVVPSLVALAVPL